MKYWLYLRRSVLVRDLWRLRGQILAIALVVACGIASFVSMLSAYESLKLSQAIYYDRYRFAHVFVQLKRSPESLQPQLAAIPGVAQIQTRVVADVNLDIPGRNEPATGRLISIPERQTPMLNDLYIRYEASFWIVGGAILISSGAAIVGALVKILYRT
nr:hypothetical protein [Chamaesiphon polymorphus]